MTDELDVKELSEQGEEIAAPDQAADTEPECEETIQEKPKKNKTKTFFLSIAGEILLVIPIAAVLYLFGKIIGFIK